jgi:hypothetical protein
MQGIYSYTPEGNLVFRVYSVAAALYLQVVLRFMLFGTCIVLSTFISALSAVCVQCPIWLFLCSSLISCFPGILLRHCLNGFEMVPVAPVITSITFAFTFHMR